MKSFAWLGPVGELRQVPVPQAGVSVAPERTRNQWQALGGSLFTQQAGRVHRSWTFAYVWDAPADLAWFAELASGVVVGPIYLYTAKAAMENLAPPALQTGGTGVSAGRRILKAGDADIRVSRQIPVMPSKSYTLSALTGGSGSLTRKIFNAAGVEQASVALAAGAAGARVSATFTTPATAAYMTLTPTAGIGQVRLTEGAHFGFQIGDGVAPVQVIDPDETLQQVLADDPRSDFQITVREVG